MSRNYKIRNPQGAYFITFAVVEWVDALSRSIYKDIIVESLKFCQKNKGLEVFAWSRLSRDDNKPIEVFSNSVIRQKLNYIHENPVEEGLVAKSWDYLYSSARDYAGESGMLEI